MALKAVDAVTDLASGTITVSLYKGHISFVSAANTPHSLYSEENASMEAIGSFDHADSEGFLQILGLSARVLASAGQVRKCGCKCGE